MIGYVYGYANMMNVEQRSSNFDSDALTFITVAGITDATQKTAIDKLVKSLKSANIWTKIKAFYPFVGGVASSHRYNLLDARALDAAFYIDFFGGWTHDSNGITGNGSSSYANTKLNTSAVLTANNLSIGFYTKTNRVADTTPSRIAYGNSENKTTYVPITQFYLRRSDNTLISDLGDYNYGRVSGTNTTTAGFYVNTRTSATSNKTFKNNSLFGSSTTNNPTNTLPNKPLYIGAMNEANLTVVSYETISYQSFYVSDGLSDSEATALHNACHTFNTTLGRNY